MSQQVALDQLSLYRLAPSRGLVVRQGQRPGRGMTKSGALSN
jgi:hypothetical protein